jgi:tRNA-specific 2-thiouridylase
MNRQKKKIVVAISGGIDSSVAALLLKKQGYQVIGLFMKLGFSDEKGERAARAICQKLNIKLYPINLALKFKQEIIEYFLDSYARGLTPNPCVKCNQVIKFGELLRLTRELKAEYLATGHYAKNVKLKIKNEKWIYKLLCGKDREKDQSYFLYNLTQRQLAHILFPLGKYTKKQVKEIADKEKLPYLARESQDICFIKIDGKIADHNDFLKKHLKLKPGPIMTLAGEKVGEHQGLPLYTVGQRKGVEIGGIGPFYAVRADYKANTLYVAKNSHDPALFSNKLIAQKVNWVAGIEPKLPLNCQAVIRYRHKPVNCLITKTSYVLKRHRMSDKEYLVEFRKPLRAVTVGQSVVFYLEQELIGGGIIIN